jgi:hypothetical protein
MDIRVYLDHYLDGQHQQRRAVFAEAASTSMLMHGVKFLCQHFYHLFDWYCKCYMLLRLRLHGPHTADDVWKKMSRLYVDAIDSYHVVWVIATLLCYLIGWQLWNIETGTTVDWCLWIVPLVFCVYRVFEILAALIEMYFRPSDAKHHQFRILLHASLHYLAAGFSFALFYAFADWGFASFSSKDQAGKLESQFEEWFEPIYYSLTTVVAFSPNGKPQDWIGKLLNLIELIIGFMLVTFIFMNITQIWAGSRSQSK